MDPKGIEEELLNICTEELPDAIVLDMFHGAANGIMEENDEIEGLCEEIQGHLPLCE